MFENEKEFRKLVAGLRTDAAPDPAHRERLRRQVLEAFESTAPAQATQPAARSRAGAPQRVPLRQHWAVKLAVAAVVFIATGATIWSLYGPPAGPSTWEQVRVATRGMPWLHAVVSLRQDDEVRTQEHWYNFAAGETYVTSEEGAVLGWEYGDDREKSLYSPRLKAIVVTDLPEPGLFGARSAYNLVDAFDTLAAGAGEMQEWESEHEGRSVRVFAIEHEDPGFNIDGRRVARLRMSILADARTRRVVAANIEHLGGGGSVLAREDWAVSYPKSGPRNIYEAGAPTMARIEDLRQRYRGTPGDGPVPIPTPENMPTSRMVPLGIELPEARFSGTPQNYRMARLEKPRSGPRPPFLAPAGTTNVAYGKPVRSSEPEPVYGSFGMITDGDKEASDGSVVELGPFPQHITIDLGEPCEIYAVVVWHDHRWPRIYYDVVVEVSNSRTFRTGVTTVFNNDIDNSLGHGVGRDLRYVETSEGKLIDCKGIRGRYVRLHSAGNANDDLNHYIEVEVYGRPLTGGN